MRISSSMPCLFIKTGLPSETAKCCPMTFRKPPILELFYPLPHLSKALGGVIQCFSAVQISNNNNQQPLKTDPNVCTARRQAGSPWRERPSSDYQRRDKDMNIKPTHYTLRSPRNFNGYHLRFWTLEGSRDGSEWIVERTTQN
jgi:hypothetical protein